MCLITVNYPSNANAVHVALFTQFRISIRAAIKNSDAIALENMTNLFPNFEFRKVFIYYVYVYSRFL